MKHHYNALEKQANIAKLLFSDTLDSEIICHGPVLPAPAAGRESSGSTYRKELLGITLATHFSEICWLDFSFSTRNSEKQIVTALLVLKFCSKSASK